MTDFLKPYPKPEKHRHRKKTRSETERHRLESKLDALVSQFVIMRDGGCVTPDSNCYGHMTCSHYYARGTMRVRFDLVNCNCQCQGHNNRHNYFTSYYTAYMLKKYSAEQFDELTANAKIEKWKWSIPELRKMVLEMTVKISEFRKEPRPPLIQEV